jgi:anti-anti-sigma factor
MKAPLEHVSVDRRGDVVLAQVSGEVDLSNVANVKEQILDAVPNTAIALVLDLSRSDYLDSSGVRLIFELGERLGSRGQRLALVVPDDSFIRRVLMLMEVQQAVPMHASLDEALQG